MKSKGTYAVCLLLLICLICSAFYAPSLVMQWNDYQLLQDYDFQKRNGIDYEAMNTGYIADRKERLNAFAKGIGEGRQYFIASTGEEPEQWEEVLAYTLKQDLCYLMQEMGILWWVEGLYDSSNITAWDHYVIYDSDSVAFLCWYVELTTPEETVRMLIDAVDYTIYYVECYQEYISNVLFQKYAGANDWNWITYNLMNLKQLYGDDTYSVIFGIEENESVDAKKWVDKLVKEERTNYEIMGNQHEIISEIQLEEGNLQLSVCFLDDEDSFYGVGIGIDELKELLPSERKGEGL